MRRVRPGRLDVRVLSQATYWVTREAVVLRVGEMSVGHLQGVAGMLHGRATLLHVWAMLDALDEIWASALADLPCGDVLEFAATGASIADMEANAWLASTPMMRAIARLLVSSD